MNRGSLSNLVGLLREAVRPGDVQTLSDADLLRRWLHSRDEAAFELLVWRHGRLVLSVCRRLLSNAQDVEDAFQATFLVLVRKAKSIALHQALAAWLYTVAFRVASEVRARGARSAKQELADLDQMQADVPRDERELRQVIDEEVQRLPEKYRVPFILCHLEGKTNEQAARELGRPVGTILSRLSRARERLRERLTKRGMAPTATCLGPVLMGEVLTAELVSLTSRSALTLGISGAAAGAMAAPVAALVEGALHTMFVAKMKAAMAIVLTVAVVGVGGGWGYHLGAQDTTGGATKSPDGIEKRYLESIQELEKVIKRLEVELTENQARGTALRAELDKAKRMLATNAERLAKTAPDRRSATVPANPTVTTDLHAADLRDRIELLKLKVASAQADVEATTAMLQESNLRLQGAEKAARTVPGSISRDDLAAAKLTVDKYKSERVQKQAALAEAQLLLRQAERRLTTGATSTTSAASLEQRVADLEKQVAEMRDQMRRSTEKPKTTNPPNWQKK